MGASAPGASVQMTTRGVTMVCLPTCTVASTRVKVTRETALFSNTFTRAPARRVMAPVTMREGSVSPTPPSRMAADASADVAFVNAVPVTVAAASPAAVRAATSRSQPFTGSASASSGRVSPAPGIFALARPVASVAAALVTADISARAILRPCAASRVR